MKLAILDLDNLTAQDQYKKVKEEIRELLESKGDLREAIDVIQSLLGYINKFDVEDIFSACVIHEHKLIKRQETGRCPEILKWVELKYAE